MTIGGLRPYMGFLHLIFASALSIIFPLGWFYKPLSAEADAGEAATMHIERNIASDSLASQSSHSQRRLDSSKIRHDDAATNTRGSWRRSMSFDNIQRTMSWFWSKDGRRREGKTLGETLPPLLEAQEDRSRRHKLDLCAERDVIKECQALNDKISATALSLVDEWSQTSTLSRKRQSHAPVGLGPNDQKYLQAAFGVTLFRFIKRARSSPPSANLQDRVVDALQSLAVFTSSAIVSQTFYPGLSHSSNVEMHEIFKDMLSQEPRATALRWRALTYVYSNRNANVQKFTADCIESLAHYFSATFILAGEKFSSAFLSRMHEVIAKSEIIESALQLSEKLKTSFFSVHIDTYFVEAGLPFREDTMGLLGPGLGVEAGERGPVLCTLELGIREIASGYATKEEQGRTLLKPIVLLEY